MSTSHCSIDANVWRHRAGYVASTEAFLSEKADVILGVLSQAQPGNTQEQFRAWLQQIEVLRAALVGTRAGMVCWEFIIPRIGKRADVVLLLGDHVLVIEFKVGATTYDRSSRNQAIDYALDFRNFHAGSHHAKLVPVLVATDAPSRVHAEAMPYDGIYPLVEANEQSLREIVCAYAARATYPGLSHLAWLTAPYRPTPTIIEASQVLYRGHHVTDITRSEAGADNLGATTVAISRIVDQARANGSKAICLVSGVPGAGKTLAGLNVVCQRRRNDTAEEEHVVFLSGNGPLVAVLQEALARDDVRQHPGRSKAEAHRQVVSFIQDLHHFRDNAIGDQRPPIEHVVIFDEAQRAWNRDQTIKFMKQKRGRADFSQSEPEFLISVLDRHPTWAVIVGLIGGGQEINTGEAGLKEWLTALRDHFPDWQVYLPPQMDAIDYLSGFSLSELGTRVNEVPALHLGVSLRSFRAEHLATLVAHVMRGHAAAVAAEYARVKEGFPIVITRSLVQAKAWVRTRARGSERYGLLASSGGKRLKPLGVCMDVQIDPPTWFLNDASDVRSSCYLEDAASEFDVQGLELDWAVVLWDGDLMYADHGWRYRAFRGTKWLAIHDAQAQRYRLNAYRVLLTRARQGMVIVVPEGSAEDPTRVAEYYDPTWIFLRDCGFDQLPPVAG